jgi:hypothetical protein
MNHNGLGREPDSLPRPLRPACHSVAVARVSPQKHASLGSDLIYPQGVMITWPVEIDDIARGLVEDRRAPG